MTGLRPGPSVVTLANEKVSIVAACRLAGVELSDEPGYGTSMKVHCPFETINHSDSGVAPAMRVYTESNSAWCFACQEYFTPVKLIAAHRGIDYQNAATLLLDHVGYRPASLSEQWAELTSRVTKPDRTLLADALKTYCLRVIPGWEIRQFDREEAAMLTRCLALIDRVKTEEDAQRWLTTTKEVMARRFLPEHSSAIK